MQPPEVSVLFEDKYLLALNKPHGIVVEHEPNLKFTLQSLALEHICFQEKYPQKCFIGVPHRLDRPVSGVVLFAKKKNTLKELVDIFYKREIQKTYLAVTRNRPSTSEGELINWLVKDLDKRKAIIYDKEVKNSMRVILRYQFVSQNGNGSLLRIKLITGKFHQIRAQLSHIGCAVIGDVPYGSDKTYKENAICLHAQSLELIHPATKENLKLIADTPDDEIWNSFKTAIA